MDSANTFSSDIPLILQTSSISTTSYDTSSATSTCDIQSTSLANCVNEFERISILDGKFFKIVEQDEHGHNITALCVKCGTVKIRGQKNATSNFVLHLKRRHGKKAFEEYQNYKLQKGLESKETSCLKSCAKNIKLSQTKCTERRQSKRKQFTV